VAGKNRRTNCLKLDAAAQPDALNQPIHVVEFSIQDAADGLKDIVGGLALHDAAAGAGPEGAFAA